MKKTEAKDKLINLRQQLVGADVTIDDGYDDGDQSQNAAFSLSLGNIRSLRSRVADVDVDGIDCDALWKESFKSFATFNGNAPEDVYNQTLTYIDLLLAEIEQGEKGD